MKRFWNVFFPCCLRANDDDPGDYPRGVQGRSEHPVIPEAPKPNADTLENLQKQLDIEMQVRKGAENLILAYSKAPSKKKKHRKAAQRMHQDCVNKIQVLQTLILQAQKETCETSVSAPAPEEAPEIDAITSLGAQLGETPVKDIEAIVEKILKEVFEVISDVSSPAPEEAPGVELEASLEKYIEAMSEKILEDVFEVVSDVSSPASEEALGVEVEASPEKDIETILEKILEDVFEIITYTETFPQPEPEEASAPNEASLPAHLSELTPDIQIPVELPQETAAAPVITTEPEIPESSVENIVHEDPEAGGAQPQVNISLEDFRCCAVLGKGSFGKVFLAEYSNSKRLVALKTQNKLQLIRSMTIHRLMGEKEVFQTISSRQHPFLVNLFASFQTETNAVFVMEYAAGGDLETQLKNTVGGLPKPRAMFYAACITLGVECLHQLNIVHRDLKAENIVIDLEGFAKITDFGLCKTGMGFGDHTTSVCGSLPYIAPEILSDISYTRAVDWWSVGALLYAMLVGRTPYIPGNSITEMTHKILNTPVEFPSRISKKGTALLRLLLEKNPKARLGAGEKDAEELKVHRFFKKINWKKMLDKTAKPPFLPKITSPEDVSNFPLQASQNTRLAPPKEGSLPQEVQDLFQSFDWIAEHTL